MASSHLAAKKGSLGYILVRCPTYLAIACVWFRTPFPPTTKAGNVPKVKAPEEYMIIHAVVVHSCIVKGDTCHEQCDSCTLCTPVVMIKINKLQWGNCHGYTTQMSNENQLRQRLRNHCIFAVHHRPAGIVSSFATGTPSLWGSTRKCVL